jgi:hypothetical protein
MGWRIDSWGGVSGRFIEPGSPEYAEVMTVFDAIIADAREKTRLLREVDALNARIAEDKKALKDRKRRLRELRHVHTSGFGF